MKQVFKLKCASVLYVGLKLLNEWKQVKLQQQSIKNFWLLSRDFFLKDKFGKT